MLSIGNLCERLGIRHPLDQSTCIGYGQRKPTCGCAVAEASRQTAVRILQHVARDIEEGTRVQRSDLKEVASLLLCKRWHQLQAEENVVAWLRQLRDWSPSISSTSSIRISEQTPRTTSTSTSSNSRTDINLKHVSNKDLLREIRRRVNSGRHPRFQDAIIELAESLMVGDDEIHTGSAFESEEESPGVAGIVEEYDTGSDYDLPMSTSRIASRIRTQQSRLPSTTGASRTLVRQSQDRTVARRSTNAVPQSTSTLREERLALVRPARTAALTPSPTTSTPATIPTPSSSHSASPLRQSHLDCSVCLLPYNRDVDGQQEVWECGQCLNRVHGPCFDAWAASRPAGVVVRCMFCRAEA